MLIPQPRPSDPGDGFNPSESRIQPESGRCRDCPAPARETLAGSAPTGIHIAFYPLSAMYIHESGIEVLYEKGRTVCPAGKISATARLRFQRLWPGRARRAAEPA